MKLLDTGIFLTLRTVAQDGIAIQIACALQLFYAYFEYV